MNIISFQFQCPHCGSYEVRESTFRQLITPAAREKIDSLIQSDSTIIGFVADWVKECPRCKPKFSSPVHLSIVREKK